MLCAWVLRALLYTSMQKCSQELVFVFFSLAHAYINNLNRTLLNAVWSQRTHFKVDTMILSAYKQHFFRGSRSTQA